jgi:hypothetical protein
VFRLTRQPSTVVRLLDVPIKMTIEPNFIITPIGEDKVMIIYGTFTHVKDQDAYKIVENAITKIAS